MFPSLSFSLKFILSFFSLNTSNFVPSLRSNPSLICNSTGTSEKSVPNLCKVLRVKPSVTVNLVVPNLVVTSDKGFNSLSILRHTPYLK